MAKRKLPKSLYAVEVNNDGHPYYLADPNLAVMVNEIGEKTLVGIYKLDCVMDAEGVVQTSKTRKP